MANEVFDLAYELMGRLHDTQEANILAGADCVVDTFKRGRILQAFGSGHSLAGALELCHRAGGFIPTKCIREPAYGNYEAVPGVGEVFMRQVEVLEGDTVVIISNSGRNPLPIEIAIEAKKRGAHVIAVTSLESSKKLSSRHPGGKNLYEYADVVIDNGVPDGDACIKIEGVDTEICGMSTIVTATAMQWMVLETAKKMVAQGLKPPFYKSQNVDGGTEYNLALMNQYLSRIYHI